MFKGLGNLTGMLKQAQEVGTRLQSLNEELNHRRATGSAGAGLVEVEVNGLGQVLRVSIDSSLIERKEKEVIEDLVPAAVNQAQAKAKEMHAEAMRSITGGFNLPGLDDALAKMTQGETKE
jgi:DNA-binding YbaB/EbfC family protein